MKIAIKVENLYKYYKQIKAVNGVSFEVYENEIFGMVGPNGAGKTTIIECIEGLRKPDDGVIEVLGLNPFKDIYALRKKIGIQLQESSFYPRIKVKEAIKLFQSFYSQSISGDKLLERFNLENMKNIYYENLSGGQKTKLQIILSLIGNPKIVFLDELTTGLDPYARRDTWNLIKEIRSEGKTVFLTSHYMEEVEELCDRVCIIDYGKIIALDRPDSLIRNLGFKSKISFTTLQPFDLTVIESLNCVNELKKIGNQIIIYGKNKDFLIPVIKTILAQNLSIQELKIKSATLEDVYLTLTGHELWD